MSYKTCKSCLFGDGCSSQYDCDDYSPLDDDEDAMVEYIETRRQEFYEDWDCYANEYDG